MTTATHHENAGMRISGDVYLQRLGATEQPVVGPLPAEVFGVQAQAKLIDVRDTRRGKRGQRLFAVPDQEPATGTLTLLAAPPKVLAMVAMGSEIAVAIAGGTVSGEAHPYVADYGVQLAQRNVGSVVVTGGTHASLDVGVVLDNNALTVTAVATGTGGNSITLALVDPLSNNATLSVTVVGPAITVHLSTSGVGAITSTAAAVLAAVRASVAATALVSIAHKGASTGAAAVTAVTATPLAGGSAAGTTYVQGTDYALLDAHEGIIRPLTGGAMGASGTCYVSYSHGAISGAGVVWGSDSVVRCAVRLVGINDASASGEEIRWAAPSVLLTPDGEIDLMSADPIKIKFKMAPETLSGESGPAELTYPVFAAPA